MALNFNKFPFGLTAAVSSVLSFQLYLPLWRCVSGCQNSYRVLMKCGFFFFSPQLSFVI